MISEEAVAQVVHSLFHHVSIIVIRNILFVLLVIYNIFKIRQLVWRESILWLNLKIDWKLTFSINTFNLSIIVTLYYIFVLLVFLKSMWIFLYFKLLLLPVIICVLYMCNKAFWVISKRYIYYLLLLPNLLTRHCYISEILKRMHRSKVKFRIKYTISIKFTQYCSKYIFAIK